MNQPFVSVIVPIYNTAQYLPKCLDSIVNQTYRNLEIICFIDASPDNSLEIVQNFAEKDDRIVIINSLTNVKQGGGRNRGILQSRANYVAFVDSDDWLAESFVEDIMAAILLNDADIGFCDYYLSNMGDPVGLSPLGDCRGLSYNEMRRRVANTGVPIWSAIYKKDIIIKNDLFFPEHVFYEDNAVSKSICLCAKKYSKVNKYLYYYRNDNPSTMRSKNNPGFYDRLQTAIMFRDHCERLGLYNEFKDEIDTSFLNLYYRGTVIGTYEGFNPVPFSKIIEVNKFILKQYGLKKTLSFIRKKPFTEQCILASSLISPKLGLFLFKLHKKACYIKHLLSQNLTYL